MVRSECVQDTTRGSPEQDKGIKIQYASPRYCGLSGTPDNVPLVLGRVPRQDSAHSENLKGTETKGGQGEVMIAPAKSLIKAV